jgi:hypothetical protein
VSLSTGYALRILLFSEAMEIFLKNFFIRVGEVETLLQFRFLFWLSRIAKELKPVL